MEDKKVETLEAAAELLNLVLTKENQRVLQDTGKSLFNHNVEINEIYRGKTLVVKIELLYNKDYFRKWYKEVVDGITLTFLVSKNGYVRVVLRFKYIHTKGTIIEIKEEVHLGKGNLRDILINFYLLFHRLIFKGMIRTIAEVLSYVISPADLINIPSRYIVGKMLYEIFRDISYTDTHSHYSYSGYSHALHQSYSPYIITYLSAFINIPAKTVKKNYENLGLTELTDAEFFRELTKFEGIDYMNIFDSRYGDTDFTNFKKRFYNAYSKSPRINSIHRGEFFYKNKFKEYKDNFELYKSAGNSFKNKLKNKTVII